MLNEAEAASRIGIDVPTLRRLRFHRIGPQFTLIDGKAFYPVRRLDGWKHSLKTPTPVLFATPIAEATYSFLGD